MPSSRSRTGDSTRRSRAAGTACADNPPELAAPARGRRTVVSLSAEKFSIAGEPDPDRLGTRHPNLVEFDQSGRYETLMPGEFAANGDADASLPSVRLGFSHSLD